MTPYADHPDDLLPWHVNATLAGEQDKALAVHLQGCTRCRDEVAWLRQLRLGVQADVPDAPGEFGLNRLLRQVRQEAPAKPIVRSWTSRTLAAAATIIVVQAAFLVNLVLRPAAITPLGGSVAAGVVLQVKFVPDASEAQIRQVLQQEHAAIVDGPGALGIYRLRLEDVAAADEQAIRRIVGELAAQRGVVAYVARE